MEVSIVELEKKYQEMPIHKLAIIEESYNENDFPSEVQKVISKVFDERRHEIEDFRNQDVIEKSIDVSDTKKALGMETCAIDKALKPESKKIRFWQRKSVLAGGISVIIVIALAIQVQVLYIVRPQNAILQDLITLIQSKLRSKFLEEKIVLIVVSFLLGLVLITFIAIIIYDYICRKQCPECYKLFAIKLITREKLEGYEVKYKFQCKYCGFEREEIFDITPYILP